MGLMGTVRPLMHCQTVSTLLRQPSSSCGNLTPRYWRPPDPSSPSSYFSSSPSASPWVWGRYLGSCLGRSSPPELGGWLHQSTPGLSSGRWRPASPPSAATPPSSWPTSASSTWSRGSRGEAGGGTLWESVLPQVWSLLAVLGRGCPGTPLLCPPGISLTLAVFSIFSF